MKKSIAYLLVLLATTSIGFSQNNKARQDSIVKESEKTEVWQPVPKVVTPGKTSADAPSDAIVLFDGQNLNQWQTAKGGQPGWKMEDGILTVVKGSGDIVTKQSFGSCQLHIEWRAPSVIAGSSQSRGNSGIFLMGKYELQVLDSYENPTYVNGQAGSIYKQLIPLVNASRKPGEWQSYDIVFSAPKFASDGSVLEPARITVLHNGVLVQNNGVIKGSTEWIGQPKYSKHGEKEPLVIQDHGRDGGQPVSFRNIWIREL